MTFLAIVISSGKQKKIRTRARGPRGGAAGEGGGGGGIDSDIKVKTSEVFTLDYVYGQSRK